MSIAAIKMLEDRYRRPDHPAVASFLDARAGPDDPVLYSGFRGYVLLEHLALYYEREHPTRVVSPDGVARELMKTGRDGRVARVFLLELQDPALRTLPVVVGASKTNETHFPGLQGIVVGTTRASDLGATG